MNPTIMYYYSIEWPIPRAAGPSPESLYVLALCGRRGWPRKGSMYRAVNVHALGAQACVHTGQSKANP